MAELKKALAANFEGEYEKVGKLCYEAPKHGNDIPEVNKLVRRVYDSILQAFQNVDGGGNYISKDIKICARRLHQEHPQPDGPGDRGAADRQEGRSGAHRRQSVGHAGNRCQRADRAGDVRGERQDAIKFTATHMNMKLPPDQLKTRKGRENVLNLVKTYFDNDGYHIQFNVLDTDILRDAQKHPENYRDLVVRVAGFSAFFTRLHMGVQDEIIDRTEQSFGQC